MIRIHRPDPAQHGALLALIGRLVSNEYLRAESRLAETRARTSSFRISKVWKDTFLDLGLRPGALQWVLA